MDEFPGNSKTRKAGDTAKAVPKKKAVVTEKVVEKVVKGEAVQAKPSMMRRFKETFFGDDASNVGRYVMRDVILPAVKDLIVDAGTGALERMIFGEVRSKKRQRSGGGSHYQYNTPIGRASSRGRDYPPEPRSARTKHSVTDVILPTREDCEAVIEGMNDILDKYEEASAADFWELIGLPHSHTDNKWGWIGELEFANVQQTRDGWLLVLPEPELIE